jgi:hypothetical protein
MTASTLSSELTQGYSTLIKQHTTLHKQLSDLARIAALQLNADAPRIWSTILEQKRLVIEQVERLNVSRLFLWTRRFADGLGVSDEAQQLNACAARNASLLRSILETEAAAQERLALQTRDAHLAMSGRDNMIVKLGVYVPGTKKQDARFLDSHR